MSAERRERERLAVEILLGKAHARTGTHRLSLGRAVVVAAARVGTSDWIWTNGLRAQLPSPRGKREKRWGSRLRFVTSSILNGGDAQPCGRYIGGRVQCAHSTTCANEKGLQTDTNLYETTMLRHFVRLVSATKPVIPSSCQTCDSLFLHIDRRMPSKMSTMLQRKYL